MATWPGKVEYSDAVQAPSHCFQDPDLRAGETVVDALGLPVPCSGGFAVVYQVRSADRQESWAVKCFTKSVPGLKERYREISQHLAQARLRLAVEFKYLEEGILVRGEWYPVLKMRWVEGLTLRQFVQDNLEQPRLLEALYTVWLKVEPLLVKAKVAHGDLQHGNVLLVPGKREGAVSLRLIDYDGMWVPALAGQPPPEAGHPAYQHSQRAARNVYTADVDRFPHLVVACALKCLARGNAPALWKAYDDGDNLLFKKEDFESPATSDLLKRIWRSKDEESRAWAGHVAIAAASPLEATSPLSRLLTNGTFPSMSASEESQARSILHETAQSILPRPAPLQMPPLPTTSRTDDDDDLGDDLGDLDNFDDDFDDDDDDDDLDDDDDDDGENGEADEPHWGFQLGVATAAAVALAVGILVYSSNRTPHGTQPTLQPMSVATVVSPAESNARVRMDVLTRAQAAMNAGQSEAARSVLDTCPEALRGVEWKLLSDQVNADAPSIFAKKLELSGLVLALSPDWSSTATSSGSSTTGLVSGSNADRHSISLWDRAFDKPRRVLLGHQFPVVCAVYSHDGSRLASGSGDGEVRIWNVATGESERIFGPPIPQRAKPVSALAFSPNDKHLAVMTDGQSVRICDAASGEAAVTLPAESKSSGAFSLAFASQGSRLISGIGPRLWDSGSWQEITFENFGPQMTSAVAVDRSGRRVAVAAWDKQIHVFNASTGQKVSAAIQPSNGVSLAFSPDGTRLASVDDEGRPAILETETGLRLVAFDRVSPASLARKPRAYVAFDVAGDNLAVWQGNWLGFTTISQAADPTVEDTEADASAMDPAPPVLAPESANTPDSKPIAARMAGKLTLEFRIEHSAPMTSVSFSPNNSMGASLSNDGELFVWHADTGKVMHRTRLLRKQTIVSTSRGKRIVNTVLSASVSSNLAFVTNERLVFSQALTISHYSYKEKQQSMLATNDVRKAAGAPVMLVPTNVKNQFLFGTSNGTVVIADLSKRREDVICETETGSPIRSVAHARGAPRGVSREEGRVVVWDTAAGVKFTSWELSGSSGHVDISADGRRVVCVASPESGCAFVMWDLAAPGNPPRKFGNLVESSNTPIGLAVSPDGRLALACEASSHHVALWDLDAGVELATGRSHTSTIQSIAFSPDGKYAVSGAADKSVVVWRVDVQVSPAIDAAVNGSNERLAPASPPGTVKPKAAKPADQPQPEL